IFGAVLLSFPPLRAADGSIGKVIGLAGGAVVVREGGEIPIEVGMEIRVSDTVRTASDGRVRVLFNDDSLAAVGPGSLFRMDEYSDSGSDQSFKAHVTEGLARFVTGKIVEANPNGFQVTAPDAVVGIRGTIITVRATRERTTVYVENTTRHVYANNVDVPSGHKISFPGGADLPIPITPEDRREISRDLAFLGGEGSAAAAPASASEETRTADAGSSESGEGSSGSGSGSSGSGSGSSGSGSGGASSESGEGDSESGGADSDSGDGDFESSTFAGVAAVLTDGYFGGFSQAVAPMESQSLGDSIVPSLVYASYSYTGVPNSNYDSLSVGFEINLQNGDIRNAFINADYRVVGYDDFSISGGSGSYRDSGGFYGYYADGFTGHTQVAPTAYLYLAAPPYTLGDSTAAVVVHNRVWDNNLNVFLMYPHEVTISANVVP
ncbi:MAG: FecR family protein, partial [Deltaproteobacteria bacterium]|nr:FecR family protein [Deltaproteobacteria bacterium]